MAAPVDDSPRVRVAAVLLIDGKVVLARHRKGPRAYHLLPGGGVERGETLEQALVREVAEETGLSVDIGRPLILNDTIDPAGRRHLVNVTFSASVTGGSLTAYPGDDRVEALDLVAPDDLADVDLRPPFATELARAIAAGDEWSATYLGALYVEE